MGILYGAGLVLALAVGGTIVMLLKARYYERIASQQGEYEKEMDERGQFDAALLVLRQILPNNPEDNTTSAA